MRLGQELGPFTIEKEIGSGAMGTVYRGRFTATGQAVAVKVIAGGHDANPTALARFERETEILKHLKHPNIVRLYANGRHRETPFYVMEYVDGDSLETLLQRRGRFTWEEVITVGLRVCEALKHAHGKGIVHRDLKPANIMMTTDGTVKLTDFGIAKGLEGLESIQLTSTNCTVGTASYMSPEQCRGEPNLTYKSDLYSLGVVFYELLTGKRPFTADNTLKMFLAHTEGTFERPSRHVMDIPVWLDTLVCQLMEKEPAKRPLDAALVSRALQDITDKVAAQRSAGVDLATARRIDVPKNRRPKNEADREAARLLRDAATKKKNKRKSRPIFERKWFQALGITALLAGVAFIVWHVTRPPAPEQLYEHAHAYMSSDDPAEWDKARHGPIETYFKHYKNRNDDQAKQMRRWADQADVALQEKQLHNRMRLKLTPEGEAEPIAQAAIRYEEAGELDLAKQRWEQLLKYKDEADSENRPLGLLAAKHLEALRTVEHYEYNLSQGMSMFERDTEAYRAEHFGDYALAMDRWKSVRETTGTVIYARAARLLAARKLLELDQKMPRGRDLRQVRLELIADKLAAADELRSTKPEEALVIYRDVVLLYGQSSDAALRPHVEAAQAEVKKLAPNGP